MICQRMKNNFENLFIDNDDWNIVISVKEAKIK